MTHDEGRRTAEILAGSEVWAEAPDVLDAVLAQIQPSSRAPRWWWATAAAAIVTVLVGTAAIVWDRPESPDFTLAGTTVAPQATAAVRVIDTPAGVVLRLEVEGLDPAAEGRYYQGWVVGAGNEVSVGTFHMRGGDGSVSLWSGVPIEDYPELIVTLQQETGGPARSDVVVLTGRA